MRRLEFDSMKTSKRGIDVLPTPIIKSGHVNFCGENIKKLDDDILIEIRSRIEEKLNCFGLFSEKALKGFTLQVIHINNIVGADKHNFYTDVLIGAGLHVHVNLGKFNTLRNIILEAMSEEFRKEITL